MLVLLQFLFLSSLPAAASSCTDHRVDKTLGVVHAHRGLGAGPGENTLASLKKAAELGADVLELDLQVTKDEQLVLHHDGAVGPHCWRLTDDLLPTREIGELPLTKLRGFRCGSPGENGADHGIPTLREFLDTLKSSKVRFNIEMKANAKAIPAPALFARLLAAELRTSGVLDRAIVQSFELKYLAAFREELSPEERTLVQRSLLLGWAGWATSWVKLAREHDLQILSPSVQKLRFGKSTVHSLHAAGVKVVPYPPDTEELWEKYLELGVDGLITNRPKELVEFLRMSPKYRCLTAAPPGAR